MVTVGASDHCICADPDIVGDKCACDNRAVFDDRSRHQDTIDHFCARTDFGAGEQYGITYFSDRKIVV